MHNNTQMILVMDHDELPAHIRQTFKLVEENGRWTTDLSNITLAFEGDNLDMDAPGYMVVFANNTWHQMSAANLYNQIKALRSDAQIIFIPVEVAEDQGPFLMRIGGGVPFPGMP